MSPNQASRLPAEHHCHAPVSERSQQKRRRKKELTGFAIALCGRADNPPRSNDEIL
jgi:hypothetical protein